MTKCIFYLIQYYFLAAALEDTNSLGHKKSELRLYCDLMMQQVHAVKSAANTEVGPDTQVNIICVIMLHMQFSHNIYLLISQFRNWSKIE